ncbi:hypothetical protein OEA41_005189 [Lepraria neglecta]|uniref:Beta-lactamase-related domain-containing protein n=1 Tax=Lepraria neglecta TaxID=209136 RepID=A0AAD9Z0M2_9LECA|nr:hypothetical protein OEA41_005189 [Lepraria neglecta]
MGAESAPKKVIGDTSDLRGFTSTYWVFPETESAVVVLTNASNANGDSSNVVAQVLTQALFNMKPTINYLSVALEMRTHSLAQWQHALVERTAHRCSGTKSKHPLAYEGEYSNSDLQMTLTIKSLPLTGPGPNEPFKMKMQINGLEQQIFELYHYHHDSRTFLPKSSEECLREGLEMYIPSWKSFNIEFGRFAAEQFHSVHWRLDPDERVEAHTFYRLVDFF